jgi:hypothetical protein
MPFHSFKPFAIMVWVAVIELSLAMACGAETLPEPTGAYPVGRVTYQLVDGSRSDDQGSREDHKREFMVQVWYPAQSGTGGKPAVWLPADTARLEEKGYLGLLLRASSDPAAKDVPKVLASVVVHAREEMPVAGSARRFPVLVFAAGSQTIASTYSSVVEDLASRGFVVIGYGPTVMGHGTWKGDLTHVLDQLGAWNTTQGHLFFGRLDLDHIGAFGHSAGGNAVSAIAASDRRLKAIVLIDPGMVRPEDGAAIPILILKSEDVEFKRRRPDVVEEKKKTRDEYVGKAKPGMQITLLGAVHMSFTDMAVIKAFGLPGDGKAFIDTSRAVIGGFFGQYLLGEHCELIEKGSAKYPLAKIDTHY